MNGLAVVNVKAPDRTTFDMLARGQVDTVAASLRGKALVRMRRIARRKDPCLLPYLETHLGVSAEYAMGGAICHAKPPVKQELVRIQIKEDLAEKQYWHAVIMLQYARVAELNMPEYGAEFIHKLFETAFGRPEHLGDAWHIAWDMVRENGHNQILRFVDAKKAQQFHDYWALLEEASFQRYAQRVLEQDQQVPVGQSNWELELLFMAQRVREGAFVKPLGEMVFRVVKAYIEREANIPDRPNREHACHSFAKDANVKFDPNTNIVSR